MEFKRRDIFWGAQTYLEPDSSPAGRLNQQGDQVKGFKEQTSSLKTQRYKVR